MCRPDAYQSTLSLISLGYHSIHIALISIKMDTIMSISGWVSFLFTHHYRIEPAKNGQIMLTEIVLDKPLQNCYVLALTAA